MVNGNGSLSLATAWDGFDPETKLRLTITELDRIYTRLEALSVRTANEHAATREQLQTSVSAVKQDFNERIGALRTDMEEHLTAVRTEVREGFEKLEKRQNRSIGLLYTMIGGIVVGLVLLVVQLAPH